MTILFSTNVLAQQPCPDILVPELTENFVVDENWTQSVVKGCTEFGYRIWVANTSEDPQPITISLIEGSTPVGPWLTPINNLQNNSGFSYSNGTWTLTTTLGVDVSVGFELTFQVDPSFPVIFGFGNKIDGFVTVTSSCQTENYNLDPIFPDGVKHVVNGTESLTAIATNNNPFADGMFTPSLSQTFGQIIKIADNSNLVVDENYHFPLGSKILMGANAKMTISNGANLQVLDQAQIIGCQTMWDRVDVQDGSLNVAGVDFSVNGKGVFIADGINGLVGNPGTSISVDRATFLNNRVGIFVPQNSLSVVCSNSHFELNSLKSPLTGQAGLAGIRVSSLKNPLVLDKNYYTQLPFGVWATNSSMIVTKDRYENISDAGILTESTANNNLNQVGNGFSLSNWSFKNCGTGIRAINVNVNSTATAMRGVTWGYSLSNGANKTVSIHDNNIQASRIGIGLSGWTSASTAGVTVKNNTININGNSAEGTGIFVENMPSSGVSLFEENDISLSAAENGIYMNNATRAYVGKNSVTMFNQEQSQGINLEDIYDNTFYCNNVYGGGTLVEHSGIRLNTTSSNNLRCNASTSTNRGILFLGENLPTTMQGNNIYNHHFGIKYGSDLSGARTGVQSHYGNQWSGFSGSNYGISFLGDNNQLQQSKILVDPFAKQSNPSLQTNEDPTQLQSIGSIFSNPTGSTYVCSGSCPPPPSPGVEGGNEADVSTATGIYLAYGSYANAQAWTAKRQLYRRLLAQPSLLSSAAMYQSFYNTETNTTVGKLEQVRAGMEGLWAVAANTQSQLDANKTSIDDKADQVNSINESLDSNTDPQQEASLLQQRSSLLQDIATLEASQGSIEANLKSSRMSAASQLLSTNNAILTTADYELMQKQVNAIVLENIANDVAQYTEAQLSTLTSIAHYCAYAGGQAVFQARALLADQASYGEADYCQTSNHVKKTEDESGLDYNLYPNPASGYVMVELDAPADGKGSIRLVNTLGELVKTQDIEKDDTSFVLFLDELPAGMYYVTVQTKAGKVTKLLTNLK